MNRISDFFYNFIKISVVIALSIITIISGALALYAGWPFLQVEFFILFGVAICGCVCVICTKIAERYKILFILAVAFITRLVWILNVNTVPVSDFLTMFRTAQEFLEGNKGGLTGYGYLARFPHLVPMMVYMMGMIKLFGGYSLIAMKCVSLLLSTLTVYLVYILSKSYVKKPVLRLVAMGIAAVYPSFVTYSSTFCTETIGVPLFILSVILFNKITGDEKPFKCGFFICGAVLYFSNLFRGVGIVFVIAFVLYIIFFSSVKKIRSLILLISGYFITAVIISTVLIGAGVVEQPLWKGKEPSFATLMLKGSNFEYGGAWNVEDANFVTEHLGDEDLSKKCFEVVVKRIREKSVFEVLGFYGYKFFGQWSIADSSGTYWATLETKYPYLLIGIFQLVYTVLLFFSLPVFLSKRKTNSPLALLFLLLIGMGILFTILETQPRYSYIVNWIFIILAVTGIEILTEDKYADFLKSSYFKYKEQANYIIFGIVTTVVNIFVYYILFSVFHTGNVISNIIAWVLSVVVAYITNKIWVFESKTTRRSGIIKEVTSFFSCRFLTGVLEVALMWIFVDVLRFVPMVMKIIVSVVVIVLNYIVSKAIVFNKGKQK